MTSPALAPPSPRAPDHVLELDQVSKRFSGHTAVDSLSLVVPRGVMYGLLGPNGAGKTTTIRMVMNILQPDSGRVRLFGDSTGGRVHSARIGYLPEERGLYRKMRVLDVLVFLGEMKGVERRGARLRANEWLERLGLLEWRLRRIEELSKGMQQKVQFISTVLHDPELVILDEPFSGLDPVNTQVLKDVVLELHRGGKTILFSTHIMEQAEKLCDQLAIIARGRKLVDGSLADIKRTHGGLHLVIGFDGAAGAPGGPGPAGAAGAAAVTSRLFGDHGLVRKADNYGQYAELELAPGADAQRILRELVAAGVRLTKFELQEPSLHKIFMDLVGPDGGRGNVPRGPEREAAP
jgi:ABC-2 type transport system ATP-binding protein